MFSNGKFLEEALKDRTSRPYGYLLNELMMKDRKVVHVRKKKRKKVKEGVKKFYFGEIFYVKTKEIYNCMSSVVRRWKSFYKGRKFC